MPLALCEPITFGCDSGPARRPHHINILHLKMLFNTGVLSPPGRPTDQSQGFSGTAFRSTSHFPVAATSQPSAYTQGQVYTLAPSTGQPPLQGHPKAPQDAQPWMEAVKAGLCIWGPVLPSGPSPSPGQRGLGPHHGHHIQPFHNWGHHSIHVCPPLGGRSKRYCGWTGGAAKSRLWVKSGMGQGGQNHP